MSTTYISYPHVNTWINYSKRSQCSLYERWTTNGNVGTYHKLSNDVESRPYPTSLLYAMTGQAEQYTMDYYKTMERCNRTRTTNCDGLTVPLLEEWKVARNFTQTYCVKPPPDATGWQTCARLRIKDRMVNLGASVAEYRETCGMFKRAASGTYDAWKALKGKKKWRNFKPRDVAAANVVTNYGVLPLYNDLYDSYEALTSKITDGIWQRVTCQRQLKDFGDVPASGNYQGKDEWAWTYSERAVLYVKLKVDEPKFTMGNPLELAWELIPFSFVVDWLIPIGNALSALDALHGVQDIRGTVTRKWKSAITSTVTTANAYGKYYSVITPGRYTYRSHQRDVVTQIPLPNLPTYRPSTSLRAVANGISLLVLLKS